MNLQPVGKNILVQIIDETPKKGSLLLTGKHAGPRKATIKAIGDACSIVPAANDTILIPQYCGIDIPGANKEESFLMIGSEDILAIIRE